MAQEILVPSAVRRELRRIGDRVRAARLERNLPMQIVAERAMTTRQTVGRIETGDPRVSWGTVLGVLNALGLLETAGHLAAPQGDPIARMKSADLRHRRARLPKAPSSRAGPESQS
ncbi:helix-turn-helix domain-containing protein [Rhodobacter sp. NSM]|uniref:helix-turn-helix domain-containing protein n=1 Tax=Rhodobacter sp. NSM TaxID=3457501 RepID=UPI003FD4F3F7